MRIPQRGERGFTLIELLIVIAIIGVLAAIAVPVFLNQDDSANAAAAEAEASALETLIAAGISLNGTVTTITDDTTITVPNVGSMTITDGTMTVSGADGTDYCALVTVGTSTVAYGPSANATNTGCEVAIQAFSVNGDNHFAISLPGISGAIGEQFTITNSGSTGQLGFRYVNYGAPYADATGFSGTAWTGGAAVDGHLDPGETATFTITGTSTFEIAAPISAGWNWISVSITAV